jgi:hypothetical protein
VRSDELGGIADHLVQEPERPASTGRPLAIASTTAKPNCSRHVALGALASTKASWAR